MVNLNKSLVKINQQASQMLIQIKKSENPIKPKPSNSPPQKKNQMAVLRLKENPGFSEP